VQLSDRSERRGAAASRSLRRRLSAAACMLAAAGSARTARAQSWQLDGSALVYGEKQRTNVVEPVARITRLFGNGANLYSQLTFDSMTGATPTGAVVTRTTQTTTSASGTTHTNTVGTLPTSPFTDNRFALDLGGAMPLGLVTPQTAIHLSHEKDYQSAGISGSLGIDAPGHLTTLTLGGGYNRDEENPICGIPVGLTQSDLTGEKSSPKDVTTAMAGLSRVLSRRLLVGANFSVMHETGYLTEPYKVVSIVDPNATPTPGGDTELAPTSTQATETLIHENRPSERWRRNVLTTGVYHLTADVVYLSYRYYWDDWDIQSHTVDLKVRHDLPEQRSWIQPHIRFYTQTPARFFTFGLLTGEPLPEFASSDQRLGPLRTATLGATYGFRPSDVPGELTIRAEYLHQWGKAPPNSAVAPPGGVDLFPPLDIGTLLVGYSLQF